MINSYSPIQTVLTYHSFFTWTQIWQQHMVYMDKMPDADSNRGAESFSSKLAAQPAEKGERSGFACRAPVSSCSTACFERKCCSVPRRGLWKVNGNCWGRIWPDDGTKHLFCFTEVTLILWDGARLQTWTLDMNTTSGLAVPFCVSVSGCLCANHGEKDRLTDRQRRICTCRLRYETP